jgi:uncharacterized membrane protein YhhN
MTSYAPALVCLIATGVLVVAEHRDHATLRASSKTLASACFLMQAWICGVPTLGAAGATLFVALIASAIGDLCLLGRSERSFLLGLGAFFLAHVAFGVSFGMLGFSAMGGFLTALCVSLVGGFSWRWLAPHVGAMRHPVLAYVLAICAMVAMAGGAFGIHPEKGRAILLGAAWVFLASDLCVARDRFVAPGPHNRTVGLPLYYLAQLGFIWGIATTTVP